MKIVAATTSHMTIQGKFVPGKGAKIRLTKGPVKVAKAALTRSSRLSASCAIAGVTVEASAARGRPSF